jgi:alkylation response protein AidB-like acyl-CoA dehydrogenase
MYYRLDSEQGMLQDAARSFFEKEVNGDLIRELESSETGFNQDLWKKMSELGWMGLTIPEAYDGYDAGFTYLAVVLEELGRSGLASPFFYTVVLGGEMIKALGSEEQMAAILPRLASGEMILSVAYAGADEPKSAADIPVTACSDGNSFRLHGSCLMVPFAHIADYIICAAQSGDREVSLFLLDPDTPGLTINALQTTAQDRQYELLVDGVRLERSKLLGKEGQSWPVLQQLLHQAAVAKCAEMVGGARRAMEMTVDYSKQRVQFGRPIGAFQAVQHHCANMLTYLDSSALITRHTCKQVSAGTASVADMAKCKAWVSDACRKLLLLAHQVYAGMGFMAETDLQIYFRRTKAAEQVFGNAGFHRETVAREMGFQPKVENENDDYK